MRPSKIRVAKYEHSATSKWVVEGLKNNKGKRSRKFFRSRIEADDFARNALQEQRQYGHNRDYLAPSTLDKLNSTLQRPDISDDFRAQIRGILAKYPNKDALRDFRQLLQRRPSPGLPHRGQAP